MRVLVVRHAVAQSREEFAASGEPDALRPLTAAGMRKMRRAVGGLRTVVGRLDRLATSPLVRARQTAELLARPYGMDGAIEDVDALAPTRKPVELVRWLAETSPEGAGARHTVALVGHEPHLSQLVAFMTTGRRAAFGELRKGGACLLELDDLAAGKARLVWCLTPKLLRALRV